jgi:hypothetical protein
MNNAHKGNQLDLPSCGQSLYRLSRCSPDARLQNTKKRILNYRPRWKRTSGTPQMIWSEDTLCLRSGHNGCEISKEKEEKDEEM